jgi:PIN like domain
MKLHDPSGQPPDSSSTGTGRSSSPNSNAGGIFDGGLDAYKSVTEEDYRSLFYSGLIILDANTLLSLYRYQSDTRRVLIRILTRLKDRLWVPHQAMIEFFENRLPVIASRSEEAGQAINDLRKKSLELETVVRQWANRVGLTKDSTGKLIGCVHLRGAVNWRQASAGAAVARACPR